MNQINIPLLISLLALLTSFVTLWFNFFKKTKPIFNVYNWTAMGKVWDLHIKDNGLSIIINLKIINNGIKPIILNDIVMVVMTENGNKKVYIPTILWDMKTYISKTGSPVDILSMQKGLVPLPIVVPSKSIFDYQYEIMFTPKDIKNPLNTIEDAPFKITLFALTSYSKDYVDIGTQTFSKEEISPIIKGNYVIAPSTEILERRNKDSLLK